MQREQMAAGDVTPWHYRGDIMSVAKRSALMARIRGKNTGPEKIIACGLRSEKIKFRRHVRSLPGCPDFVVTSCRLAVFVDGDFWHGWRFSAWQHKLTPKWREKIAANRRRDSRNHRKLRRMGWVVLRIWEHQIKNDPLACIQQIRVLSSH